jgi:hypothetical protein
MKSRTQLFVVAILVVALFLHAQGHGLWTRIERGKVIKIVSSLKTGTTEAETVAFLKTNGFEVDWTVIGGKPSNSYEVWYSIQNSTTANAEGLCLRFVAKEDMSFEHWAAQYPTNSSLVSATFGYGGTNFLTTRLTKAP